MKLIAFCIRYPVSVIVGMILALLFGVISLTRIPLQMTPTIDRTLTCTSVPSGVTSLS